MGWGYAAQQPRPYRRLRLAIPSYLLLLHPVCMPASAEACPFAGLHCTQYFSNDQSRSLSWSWIHLISGELTVIHCSRIHVWNSTRSTLIMLSRGLSRCCFGLQSYYAAESGGQASKRSWSSYESNHLCTVALAKKLPPQVARNLPRNHMLRSGLNPALQLFLNSLQHSATVCQPQKSQSSLQVKAHAGPWPLLAQN